ncbi:MAG: dihydroorotate dehydrogenase electron transfer subunit [Firmicutes bacterium]|nr:dihydroorotate dehydrogenase electron transfer subunit [Bacillota bacterium]
MKDISFKVSDIKLVNSDTVRLVLTSEEILPKITAGQFLNLEVPDNSLILRRPFCIYDYDNTSVTIYLAVVGKGTLALKNLKKGEILKATLPLGNGFFKINTYKNIGILGGGIGCAPLFRITKDYKDKNFFAYLGFNSKDKALFINDFKKTCKKTIVATNDGSLGEKGYALDFIKKDIANFDAIIMCGPHGLVKAAKETFKNISIPVLVSLEQRMACGVGACLVCTCPIIADEHQKNKRVCIEGPVFDIKEVVV